MKKYLVLSILMLTFVGYSQGKFEIPFGRTEVSSLGLPKELNEGVLRKVGKDVKVVKQSNGKYQISNGGFNVSDIPFNTMRHEVQSLLGELLRYNKKNMTIMINRDNNFRGMRVNKDFRELVIIMYSKQSTYVQFLYMNLAQAKDLEDEIERAFRN